MYPEGAAELEAELEGYLALPSMHVAYFYLFGKVYLPPVEAGSRRLAPFKHEVYGMLSVQAIEQYQARHT